MELNHRVFRNATNGIARKTVTADEGPEDGMITDDYEEPSTGNGDKDASAQQGLEVWFSDPFLSFSPDGAC
jgi:hypothetical protein